MAEGENKPQFGSGSGDPVPPVGAAGSPPPAYPSAGAPAGTTAPVYDFKLLPGLLLRMLKDPWGSLEAHYKPGKAALIGGAIIGGASVILIPWVQLAFGKMAGGDYPSDAGQTLKECLGGLVFLAAGVSLSLLLRKALAKSPSGDWQDDVYLFGSSTVFLLAATIVAGILSLIKGYFFFQLAGAVNLLGILMTAFTYYFGLVKVAKADPGRAVCVAAFVLIGALFVGALLDFNPVMYTGVASFTALIERQTRKALEGLNSLPGFGR